MSMNGEQLLRQIVYGVYFIFKGYVPNHLRYLYNSYEFSQLLADIEGGSGNYWIADTTLNAQFSSDLMIIYRASASPRVSIRVLVSGQELWGPRNLPTSIVSIHLSGRNHLEQYAISSPHLMFPTVGTCLAKNRSTGLGDQSLRWI